VLKLLKSDASAGFATPASGCTLTKRTAVGNGANACMAPFGFAKAAPANDFRTPWNGKFLRRPNIHTCNGKRRRCNESGRTECAVKGCFIRDLAYY
jgi:hypothetical protein